MIVYNAKREYGFILEKGIFADGKWVLRDTQGNFLDMDRYQADLEERAAMQEIKVNFVQE